MSCQYQGCSRSVYPGSLYCSRSHRDNAQAGGTICVYPGCTKPVYPGSKFCSRSHRDAPAVGKTCRYAGCTKPVYPGSDFCSRSHRDAGVPDAVTTNSEVHEISSTDPKYADVKNQFDTKWLHGSQVAPNVHRIYRITLPSSVMNAYTAYRQEVENSGSFARRKMSPGNERRRFHGTNRACSLGDNGNTSLCSNAGCSLCLIIKSSYRLDLAGSNKPWGPTGGGRFGPGIYTSATSSKSNDYSKNLGITSPYKTMLLNKVVVGETKKLFKDDPSLTSPPAPFHSVIGEPKSPDKKSSLNYDELVVYTAKAIIPAYLIVYRG